MPASEKPGKSSSKSAASNTTKVFDVSKPGKTASQATSRPVIVSNRPIMQDPMVAGQSPKEEAAATDSPSRVKMVIQPLSEDSTKPDAAEPESTSDTETATEPAAELKTENDTIDEKPAPESDEKPAEPEPAEDSGSDPLPGTELADKQTAALEAQAKHEEELAKLADSHEYFLPINSVEKRRSRIVTWAGIVLIVLLGLLLLNLLLDAGFIRIDGVRPFTRFFSS